MVGAKIAMLLMLLCAGRDELPAGRAAAHRPGDPVNRLKRFAEVEIGVGFAIFFAAASLTSSPPAVDLTTDRVSGPRSSRATRRNGRA
jgi:putative copper resistance protein D